jgi:hypothetical protein
MLLAAKKIKAATAFEIRFILTNKNILRIRKVWIGIKLKLGVIWIKVLTKANHIK